MMILKNALGLFLAASAISNGSRVSVLADKETCDLNGYESLRQEDPADINMQVHVDLSDDGCNYEVGVTFTPPTNVSMKKSFRLQYFFTISPLCSLSISSQVPFVNDVNATTFFNPDPDAYNAICNGEGRPENTVYPVRHAGVPDYQHVGINEHYAAITYTLELTDEEKELTGVDHITVGKEKNV